VFARQAKEKKVKKGLLASNLSLKLRLWWEFLYIGCRLLRLLGAARGLGLGVSK
jgi:hypothetical protein